MRLLFAILLSCLCFVISAQKPFKLRVVFENPAAKSIYIETINPGGFQKKNIDLVENSFNFLTEIKQVEFFKISFNQNSFIVVIALPGEDVSVSVDMADIHTTINVTGSVNTALLYGMEKKSRMYQNKVDSLINEFNLIPVENRNQEISTIYQKKADSLNIQKELEILKFINENINSPACLFFVDKLDLSKHFQLFETLAKNLIGLYPENAIINDFSKRIESHRKTAIGAVAPEIKLPGISGDSLSLYPLQGEVVIIDFWAAWCGPCRKENPHKIEIYNKYKSMGLAMFSVSLDNNGDNWRKAIVDDKLVWSDHVSELKGWQSVISKTYGVSSIPANVIIDKDGHILAKNLRGKQLDDFIGNLLNK